MTAYLLTMASYATGSAVALGALFAKGKPRLELSRAKHRSMTGHARMARRVAGLIPFYEYDEERFFRCDNPTADIAARRQAGFANLSALFRERFAKSSALTTEVAESISDLQFISAYRVPFQFSRIGAP